MMWSPLNDEHAVSPLSVAVLTSRRYAARQYPCVLSYTMAQKILHTKMSPLSTAHTRETVALILTTSAN